jgi:hypothetical protein
MYDDLLCECDLPDSPSPQERNFQTKSLYRIMDRLTITKGGRLIHHSARYVQDANPPEGLLRMIPVDKKDIDMCFHGDILLSGERDGKLLEYVVRFTQGQLEWIRPFGQFSEAERAMVLARNLET